MEVVVTKEARQVEEAEGEDEPKEGSEGREWDTREEVAAKQLLMVNPS